MDHSHNDGGKSIGLLAVAMLCRAASEQLSHVRAPENMQHWINLLTIAMLTLGITYHILGIRERITTLIRYIKERYPKK